MTKLVLPRYDQIRYDKIRYASITQDNTRRPGRSKSRIRRRSVLSQSDGQRCIGLARPLLGALRLSWFWHVLARRWFWLIQQVELTRERSLLCGPLVLVKGSVSLWGGGAGFLRFRTASFASA